MSHLPHPTRWGIDFGQTQGYPESGRYETLSNRLGRSDPKLWRKRVASVKPRLTRIGSACKLCGSFLTPHTCWENPVTKNPYAKWYYGRRMRPPSDPYEVWSEGSWSWRVLKKWQADDDAPLARWHCFITSPFWPLGERGDVYVRYVKLGAHKE